MTVEHVEALVVGAGQAGIAMSEHLTGCGVPHLVVERDRIAERWRSQRWDSLVANGPAWHDRFPGLEFPGLDPDAFAPKECVAAYFEAYARQISAPVRCGVEVTRARRNEGRPGFRVETSAGEIDADYLIAATGAFQVPRLPGLAAEVGAEVGAPLQLHSSAYRNPDQLPAGAVLVVGSGSSGTQIADELMRAGRRVYLSVGPHGRYPRRYRGRDYVWWLGVLGKWDIDAHDPNLKHVTISVSGAYGGRTIDFRRLAADGMTLLGRATGREKGVMRFAPDLAESLAGGDAVYSTELADADTYVTRNGLDLPEEPEAHQILPDPACVTDPVLELDLAAAGISTIIWATGYDVDFGWLDLDVLDAAGKPRHRRGVSVEPGLYFLGLPWLSRRGSSFIWGVWHDAMYVANHIATHRQYGVHDAHAREKAGR
jgi:putative flavoprotein involved in K+ transport